MSTAEHSQREKEVLNFFTKVISESGIIHLKSPEGHDRISARIQMIICFSLMDVVANYWFEYKGWNGKTGDKPMLWFDNFCRNKKNEEYSSKKFWPEITSRRLYYFRNSLVHFFGLGAEFEKSHISLAPNNLSDEKIEEWEREFKLKDIRVIIMRPRDFHNLIRQGIKLMLDEWLEVINEAKNDKTAEKRHIDGVNRIYQKYLNEGASYIDISSHLSTQNSTKLGNGEGKST